MSKIVNLSQRKKSVVIQRLKVFENLSEVSGHTVVIQWLFNDHSGVIQWSFGCYIIV